MATRKEKYFRVKLGYSVAHPDHPDVRLSPKLPLKVTGSFKKGIQDAIVEEEEITLEQFQDVEE